MGNQKTMFNRIKGNLGDTDCVMILDFKENFILNYDIVELGIYHYNKRQVSCFGAAIIFNSEKQLKTEYVSYFSDILSYNSLFSSDCLEKIFSK